MEFQDVSVNQNISIMLLQFNSHWFILLINQKYLMNESGENNENHNSNT